MREPTGNLVQKIEGPFQPTLLVLQREHLIGREFVPAGAFDGGRKFNFIFRTCEHCNGKKAEFERHVSSVTLFRSPARAEDERIDARAARTRIGATPNYGKLAIARPTGPATLTSTPPTATSVPL